MVEVQTAPVPLPRATAEPAALLLRGVLSPDVADRCAAELVRVPDAGRRVGGVVELLRGLDVPDDALARLLHERLGWRRREVALALGVDEGAVADWVADPPDAPRLPAHHVDPSLVRRHRAGAEALAVVVADRLTSTDRWRRPVTGAVVAALVLVLGVGGWLALDRLGPGDGVRGVAVDDLPGRAATSAPESDPPADDGGSATVAEEPVTEEPENAPDADATSQDDEAAWRPAGPTPTQAVLTTSDPRADVAVGDRVATTDGRVWLVVDVEPAEVDHILRTDWTAADGATAVGYVLVPSGAARFEVRSPLDLVVVPGRLVATADDETDDVPPVRATLEVPRP